MTSSRLALIVVLTIAMTGCVDDQNGVLQPQYSGAIDPGYECPEDVTPEQCEVLTETQKNHIHGLFADAGLWHMTGDCIMIYAEIVNMMQDNRVYNYGPNSIVSGWWWREDGVHRISLASMNFMNEYRGQAMYTLLHEGAHAFYNTASEVMPYTAADNCYAGPWWY